MRVLEGDQVCMRVFISDSDRGESRPLYKELLALFQKEKLAGATVLRGIAGFGANSHLHTASLLSLSQDLPVVIEVVDTRENIDHVMPQINRMVHEGLITLEEVHVLRYAPKTDASI